MRYLDRNDAGLQLAKALAEYADRQDVLILALPRGGVPIASIVAEKLGLAFDVMPVRKLGVPGQSELAMGAISMGGHCVLNEHIIGQLHLTDDAFNRALEREQAELARRNLLYRGGLGTPKLDNKTVILVDDGLATGATMQAAIKACKALHAREIIVAVPVGAADTCSQLSHQIDRLVCLFTPTPFWGVGHWFQDFSQVSDGDVQALMAARG